ncbi:polyketide synthase [Seiridium cupressi]
MSETEVLALVEAATGGQVEACCEDQCITGLDFHVVNGKGLPHYASDGRISHLRTTILDKTMEGCMEIATCGLPDKLGDIPVLPDEFKAAQQSTTSVAALGLDSLNAIELRNWIAKEMLAHFKYFDC